MFRHKTLRAKFTFAFGILCFLSLVLSAFAQPIAQAAGSSSPVTVSNKNSSQSRTLPGFKNYVMLGVGSDESSASEDWIKTTAPWDLRYQYLGGDVNNPNNNWAAWNKPAGQFATYYMNDSATLNTIPVFTYYCIITSPAANYDEATDFANLNNPVTVKNYFANFKLLLDKANQFGKTVIIHVEPDFWGFMEAHDIDNGSNDATKVTAAVSSSGFGDVASGLPNNLAGFAQTLIKLRDKYAPNALLAYHDSAWGTKTDLSTNTDPNLNVQAVAQQSASFYQSLNANFDLIFNDITDRDAAYYAQWDGGAHWWDATNQKLPNFNRYAAYLSALHQATQKPIVLWQLPLGNTIMRSVNNTSSHWQDNRVQYFLGANYQQNLAAYANAGVVALLFGAGSGDTTDFLDGAGDGITNPSPINGNNGVATVSDDDGGYLRQQAAKYYAAPYQLTAPPTGCTTNCSNSYNLPLIAYQANNTTTYLTLQNMSGNTANITVQYYNNASGSSLSQDTIQLPAHGQTAFLPHIAAGQVATGIVNSDQPLNVLVSEAVGSGGSAFNASSQTGTTLYDPIACNNYLGFSTALTIFNPSSSSANVTVQFYDASGNLASGATQNLNLAAHASQVVNQQGSGLDSNQFYWAKISSSGGTKLVAQVTETNPGTHFTATFDANPQLGTTLYAPAVFNNAYNFYTGMAFANPNGSAANLTINYYNTDGSVGFTQNATIPANGTWSVFQGGLSGFPAGFNGSAKVTSSQPLVAAVNENGGGSKSGTYTMLYAGGQNVGLPVMAAGAYGGYYTGTTIQNLSGSPVSLTFQYLNGDGSNAGSKTYTINPNASLQLYQGNTNTSAGLVLQSGFFGTAIISSSSPSSLVATTNAINGGLFYTYTEPLS